MKKADKILIVTIVLIAIVWLGFLLFSRSEGTKVVITVNGEKYQEISLSRNEQVPISVDGKINVLEIKNGTVDMTEANCPDHLCVNQKSISKQGETIICLPHRVVITIENGDQNELDGISN